ncbi:MAG: hypothetical protein KBT27_01635 [Prevotellaceae bacterium]|nr:hypothetical protein [Candidatus Faecinaster equi]
MTAAMIIMVILCSLQGKDWLNIILAIIGILVSGIGLFIAIHQICRMKKTSEAVHEEVIKSQKQIRQTLDSNEIGRAVKNLEQAIDFVSREEYDHALTRMMDVKSMLENEDIIKSFLTSSNLSAFEHHKHRFNESFKTVATDIKFPNNIDRRMVQNSLTDIQNYLLQIENKIKASVYERKN